MLPLDKEGNMVESDIEKQTTQVLENIGVLLKKAGNFKNKFFLKEVIIIKLLKH
jgi:enamine deaminase RidA (YjgF/YER057c/UK114 family)